MTTKYASGGRMYVERGTRDQGVQTPTIAMRTVSAAATDTSHQLRGCGGSAAVRGASSPTAAKGMKRRWILLSRGCRRASIRRESASCARGLSL